MSIMGEPITTAEVGREWVLNKCNYFCDIHLWPLESVLNPTRWLSNFDESEQVYAIHLLNTFSYFSNELVDAIFKTAFQTISGPVTRRGDPFLKSQAEWQAFVDNVIVTYVAGEVPNPTDSGYAFARKARQILGIREEQILHPADVMRELLRGPRPVVFVDDFVGSGNQFLHTWHREIPVFGSLPLSFKTLSARRGTTFYYCPAFCTERGQLRISQMCPQVRISPGHLISSRYSAFDPDSIMWPPKLKVSAVDFLRRASMRAGIPDDVNSTKDWRGFTSLGLAIAFEHSVPDATLPIVYWDENGWLPLIPRR